MLTLEQKEPRRIIVVGQTFEESRTVQRVATMRSLGCSVTCVRTAPAGVNYETPPGLMQKIRYRLRLPGDPAKTNGMIIGEVERGADILWLDAADMVRPSTLRGARRISRNLAIVWYSEDDMMNPRLRTRYLEGAFPLFDLVVTTKSFNARPEELPSLGARRILFVNNSCDPLLHRPINVSEEERKRFGAPVSFIGSFEQPRAQSVLYLARHGLKVRIWGNGWADWVGRHPNLTVENKPAYNDDFARVVSSSLINLCFLRKSNRDLQTCRSMEIPACSGFMVHERNDEITALYREDKEAAYFSSDDELAAVCSLWLNRDKRRMAVGAAARERTFECELTHESNIIRILNALPPRRLDGAP